MATLSCLTAMPKVCFPLVNISSQKCSNSSLLKRLTSPLFDSVVLVFFWKVFTKPPLQLGLGI